MSRQNEISTAAEVEAKPGADFGQSMKDALNFDALGEGAKTFLTEELPWIQARLERLAGRPEAKELFAMIAEKAKNPADNPLFNALAMQSLDA